MRTNFTLEEVREANPQLTEDELHIVLKSLNTPPISREERWAAENQVSEKRLTVGPDGLTGPQRELNEFADENALPRPFPRVRRKREKGA